MDEVVQVVTTTNSEQLAQAIAQDLVERRLAACVQVGSRVTSTYRWRGQIETSTEWTCTIKTVRRLYAAVESRLRELHDYEVPEILMLPVIGGSAAYLAWLHDELAPHP